MGQQARCTARFGRRISAGNALLETEELIFRGEFRLVIPFREMKSVSAKDGELRVRFAAGTASFGLGAAAAKWAERIRNPKSLLDKLGVRPGGRVAAIGVDDRGFLADLAARGAEVARSRPKQATDMIFFGANTKPALAKLKTLKRALTPAGAIWVVWLKGRPALKVSDVMAAGKAAGLVDVKVAKFSETHSALRLVIPVAKR